MSKFNSAFFKRNTYQLNITTKSSKKDKKRTNNNIESNKFNNISDNDFNELMDEKEDKKDKKIKQYEIKLSDYLDKIKDLEIVDQLVQEQLIGEDLICRIESEKISGSQLLKGILKKYNDPNNYNWIQSEQYGLALAFAFSNNIKEQLICLLMIQEYSRYHKFPKITYKDKQVYFLKTIFQLLFTYDIIEETTYWDWQDLLTNIIDIDEDTKNKICIQTAEFFNILKMTFTEADYEIDGDKENGDKENDDMMVNYNNHQNKINNKKDWTDDVSDDVIDEYKVPEEQDYNMDDNNFNLDDL